MVTKKQFKAMNLDERWNFLMANKDWPNRELFLGNIKRKMKKYLWLKKENENGVKTTGNSEHTKED